MTQTPKQAEPLKFEQAMDQLEKLVGQLEQGDMPLDTALNAFEQGVALVKQCQAQLKQAELRVEKVLTDEGGNAIGTEDME